MDHPGKRKTARLLDEVEPFFIQHPANRFKQSTEQA